LTDFRNPFTDTLREICNKALELPPHVQRVATLPCEILMSEG